MLENKDFIMHLSKDKMCTKLLQMSNKKVTKSIFNLPGKQVYLEK